MNLVEIQRALTHLRCSGMAAALEPRVLQAQTERMPHLDFTSLLVTDELTRRKDRLLARRIKNATFHDVGKTLDTFDFEFNKKFDRKLIFELSTGQFIQRNEDVLMLGPPGTGKSHLAQAIGHSALLAGHRVLYREAHALLEEIIDATLDNRRKAHFDTLSAASLLIIDDLGMRKLPATAAEDLLEVIMRRYERGSTLLTSNRPVEDWGKMLGDNAAVTAMLDRLLHRGHVIKCGPRSYRTRLHQQPQQPALPQDAAAK